MLARPREDIAANAQPALRPPAPKERPEDSRLERLRRAEERLETEGPFDVVVGINVRNEERTIIHVLSTVCEGLQAHFPDLKSLVMVCDGGSTDATVPLAEFYPAPRRIAKWVVPQAGGPGKGNGIRTILEFAKRARAHACAFVDGDLVSIRPIWVDSLLRPVLHGLADVTAPYYLRDKWDAVITNHLAYPFTAALYGKSVRQPLGGDHGLSRPFLEHLLAQDDLPPHFGIDIFLVTTAIVEGFRLIEVPLGLKVHASTTNYTDPHRHLTGMYLEVVGSLLDVARKFEPKWREPPPAPTVHLSEPTVAYYDSLPTPLDVNETATREVFRTGVEEFGDALRRVLPEPLLAAVERSLEGGISEEDWVRLVYAIAAWDAAGRKEVPRRDLVELLGALGMGRYLRFVQETRAMDLREAHVLVQHQAETFQRLRGEFIDRVDELRAAPAARKRRRARAARRAEPGPAAGGQRSREREAEVSRPGADGRREVRIAGHAHKRAPARRKARRRGA